MNNPIPKLISLVYFKSVVVWKPPLTAGFWPLQDCHFWASYAARDRHVEGSSILDFMRLAAYRCHSCKLWAFPHVQFIFFGNRLIQKICMVQIWRRAKQPQGLKSHVSWTVSHNPMRFFQSGTDPLKAGFGAVTKIHGTAPPGESSQEAIVVMIQHFPNT